MGGTTAAYILYESGVGLHESVSEDEGEPVVIARGKIPKDKLSEST